MSDRVCVRCEHRWYVNTEWSEGMAGVNLDCPNCGNRFFEKKPEKKPLKEKVLRDDRKEGGICLI